MISQKCPKCLSNRVRRGYRSTPLWSKVLFRYNLLCDNCNWEFIGFAVPGTVSAKPTKSQKKTKIDNKTIENIDKPTINNSISNLQKELAENLVATGNLAAFDNLASQSIKSPKTKKKVKPKSGF